MEDKIVSFDLSAETLLDLADKKFEEKDYVGALRILSKSVERNGAGLEEYALFADIYDAMDLFEMSAFYWFRYLDVCAEDEMVDAYEGLAACYYNLGNETKSAYYYNLMLQDKYLTPSNGMELGELFSMPPVKRPFRIVYPPEEADYSEEIDAGLKAIRSGDFKSAEELFSSVHEKSEYYNAARNFLAVGYLMQGKNEEAEKVCLEILREKPDDIQVLSTYAAVLTEQGRRDESREAAKRLAAFDTQSADELYKIATVCCENGLYEDAYEKFCILERQVNFDLTLLYFKSIAAFRCGKVQESLRSLSEIIDVFPDAAVAKYYFREIRRYSEEGGEVPETCFFYRLPKAEHDARVKFLMALMGISAKELRQYCAQTDLREYIDWCFDEADGTEVEIQLLGARLAVKGGMDARVRELLLDCSVNDIIKVETIRSLAARNKPIVFGVVLGDIYRSFEFEPIQIGRAGRSKFIYAYSLCFTRFVLMGDGNAQAIRAAAEYIYDTLSKVDKLSLAADGDSLACVIYFTSSREAVNNTEQALRFTGAKSEAVSALLEALRDAVEDEAAIADAGAMSEEEKDKEGDEIACSDSEMNKETEKE